MDVVTHILKDDFAKLGVQRNMENLSDSSGKGVKGVNIWLYMSYNEPISIRDSTSHSGI